MAQVWFLYRGRPRFQLAFDSEEQARQYVAQVIAAGERIAFSLRFWLQSRYFVTGEAGMSDYIHKGPGDEYRLWSVIAATKGKRPQIRLSIACATMDEALEHAVYTLARTSYDVAVTEHSFETYDDAMAFLSNGVYVGALGILKTHQDRGVGSFSIKTVDSGPVSEGGEQIPYGSVI